METLSINGVHSGDWKSFEPQPGQCTVEWILEMQGRGLNLRDAMNICFQSLSDEERKALSDANKDRLDHGSQHDANHPLVIGGASS